MIPTPFSAALLIGLLVFAVTGVIRQRRNRFRSDEQLRQWRAQNPDPQHYPAPPPAPPRPPRSGWATAGTALAAIAAIGGLAVLGMAVLFFVWLSSGNFKFGNK